MHGQGQAGLPGGPEIERVEGRGHAGISDARDPMRQQLSSVVFGRRQPGIVGPREERIAGLRLGQVAGRLHDLAGKPSASVADDDPTIGIGRVGAPSHRGKPRRVQTRFMARVGAQEQGAVGAGVV